MRFSFHFEVIDFLQFSFCFSNSGWGIGPSGGIVEPDLVTRMRLDEGSGGNFFYGPSLSLDREPFVNERYLFSDGQYHSCGPYLELEKKFFGDNAAIVREVFFDTDSLLGVDSEEELNVEEAVSYEDLVLDILPEENQLQDAAVEEIMNMNIVRVSPVNWDSEDEETMERVTSPMVVENVGDLPDASVASGSADYGLNKLSSLVIAEKVDSVERIGETTGRMTSPMVVENSSDLTDGSVATCSTDIGVDNQFCLTSAAKPECVGEIG